jgi:hypothetical protein
VPEPSFSRIDLERAVAKEHLACQLGVPSVNTNGSVEIQSNIAWLDNSTAL